VEHCESAENQKLSCQNFHSSRLSHERNSARRIGFMLMITCFVAIELHGSGKIRVRPKKKRLRVN